VNVIASPVEEIAKLSIHNWYEVKSGSRARATQKRLPLPTSLF
jgi:hypothetical protein